LIGTDIAFSVRKTVQSSKDMKHRFFLLPLCIAALVWMMHGWFSDSSISPPASSPKIAGEVENSMAGGGRPPAGSGMTAESNLVAPGFAVDPGSPGDASTARIVLRRADPVPAEESQWRKDLLPRNPLPKMPPASPPGADHILVIKVADKLQGRIGPNGELSVVASELSEVRELSDIANKWGLSFRSGQTASEAELKELERRAAQNTGRAQPDLRGVLEILVPEPTPARVLELATALNRLGDVEFVEITSADRPPPPPASDIAPPTPSLVGNQDYRESMQGIDVDYAWNRGAKGNASIQVTNCEYAFNASHEDLSGLVTLQAGVVSMYEGFGKDHGTAVLGIMKAGDNAYGISGSAPLCATRFYPEHSTLTGGVYQGRAAAVTAAIASSAFGDIVILEMQATGAGGDYGPAEYELPVWMAVKAGTDAGVIVVAAAGNGSEDLDGAGYASYRARGDSGAIIVGAGEPARSRLSFSTYGSRVDVQGWGGSVATLAYGDLGLYGGDSNQSYTGSFSGTSSATPVVASAVALLQTVSLNETGAKMSPQAMRSLLIATGRPQTGDLLAKIGPLPNLAAAIPQMLGIAAPPVISDHVALQAYEGGAFSFQVQAANSPSNYAASGLPAGLSINPSSGLISGIPTEPGNFSVSVTASNAAGSGMGLISMYVVAVPQGENILIQTLVNGTQSVWYPYNSPSLTEATLSTSNGTQSDAFDGAGLLKARMTSSFGTVTATNVWGNHAIAPQKGNFVVSFTTTPSSNAVDTVIGFSRGAADFWDDLSAYVRFGPTGKVDARNGGGFAAASSFTYVAGVSYRVEMEINVSTQRYRATVAAAGASPVLIADNYAFQIVGQTPVAQLDNFSYLTWTGGTQMVGGLQIPDFGQFTATNVWGNQPVIPQPGTFTASFTTSPSGNAVDTVIGFSSGTVDFWDDLAAYVRFGPNGQVDARNGNGFGALATLNYAAGISYLVEMEINVPTNRYRVTVTPAGGYPYLIADDFSFQVVGQTPVTQLDNFSYLTWTGGTQTVGGLDFLGDEVALPALTCTGAAGPLTATATSSNIRIHKEIRLVPGCHATDEIVTVTNLADGTRQLDLQVSDNYGSDSGTVVHMTSSGDAIVGPDDQWFVSNDRSAQGQPSGDPTLMVSWRFSGNLPDPSMILVPGSGNDNLRFNVIATLAGGEVATITIRRQLFESAAQALTEGELLGNSGAELASLSLSAGMLTPSFAPTTTNYTATVPNVISSVTVAPTAVLATSSVTVNGSAVNPGAASSPIPLNIGGNILTVVVTGQGGLTTKTYTIHLTRTPTSIQAWRQLWFGSVGNTGNAADNFDFDNDGLVNLLEFAFGLNPLVSTSRQVPQGQMIGGNLVVSFPTPAGVSGITYGAVWSTTMAPGDWQAILDTGSGGDHLFSVPAAGKARVFVKLTVANSQ
jgi:hypothetical protein